MASKSSRCGRLDCGWWVEREMPVLLQAGLDPTIAGNAGSVLSLTESIVVSRSF